MFNGQLSGPIGTLPDPTTGQQLAAMAQGRFTFVAHGDPNTLAPQIAHALMQATQRVLSQKLSTNQVALPTLAQSLPYYVQEIIAASGVAQHGVTVQQLELAVQVQQPAAQAGYQGALPPDPHTQMQNRMAQIAQERMDPRNYEVKATVEIGGFKLQGSSDKGFDTDGLAKQGIEKAKSELIWWGIGAVIVVLVLLGLAGLAWYVYREYKNPSTGTGATASDKADGKSGKSATWDGKEPFKCGGNDKLTISGVSAKFDKGTAVTASGNCKLELTDVNLDAAIGIVAEGNAVVTVKGGSVTGKEAAAKTTTQNAKVSFSGTKVTGKKDGKNIEGP